ncbi:glycosyltransferase family 2 protein [Priestia megaterium]|uniref:glycosyltransferase family 2 protein n=1 Tax=Priestia megaterium TaxID=1404 RepID=UPI00221F08C8|nr:glycosyltransferase family 2 protein [Priestia megaterium]
MGTNCAGIVLYNPDLVRLEENINAIIDQVNQLILVDNSSSNFNDIEERYASIEKIKIISNSNNYGIAKALNQVCEYAINQNHEWALLLDQDSIVAPNIISEYQKRISLKEVALLTPYIIDINKMQLKEYLSLNLPAMSDVKWAITSGSFIKLSVWNRVNAFDEDFFIDGVDIDYSIRLNICGYKQFRINTTYLLQEVGRAEPTWLKRPHKDNSGNWSFKRYYRTNHSIFRQYYLARNNIIIARKYRLYNPIFIGLLKAFIISLPKPIFEKDKLKVLKAIIKGFYDGFKHDVKKYKKLISDR